MRVKHFITGLIATIALSMPLGVSAAVVSAGQARTIATEFLSRSGRSLAPATTPQGDTSSTLPYYIFNADGGNGFVLVAGDDRLGSVLGYSLEGQLTLDGAPESLRALLDMYKLYMSALPEQNTSTATPLPGTPVVEPLLGSIAWGQEAPFSSMCPTVTSQGVTRNHYTGCVVTAATQVMKYYDHPAQGRGSKSYTWEGQTLSANFGATTYNWNYMPGAVPSRPSAANTQEYSQLAYHFGVAVEMQYAEAGSGTYAMLVPGALTDYFDYDPSLAIHTREYYNTDEWMAMLRHELDNRRPVYYGGTSDAGPGGHAFVIDGYDSNGFVHVNWGWYGRSNGYFLINALNPSSLGTGGGAGGYNLSQEMITGIRPTGSSPGARTQPIYGATRLSCLHNGADLTLMSYIENIDTHPFDGELGAALSIDGKIITVLHSSTLRLNGFAAGRSGVEMITLRNIPATVDGLPDGEYHINFCYRHSSLDDWQLLRHPVGLPSYATVDVRGGFISLLATHVPTPVVKLLSPIVTDGELYAGGKALYTLNLDNRSTDFRIKNITVRLTNVGDPSITYDAKGIANVYELSTKCLSMLLDVPTDAVPGRYTITAFESSAPDATFDDSQVGHGEAVILPAPDGPVIRAISDPIGTNAAGVSDATQNDWYHINIRARNYGLSGTASLLARLVDTNDPSRNYVMVQLNVEATAGAEKSIIFSRQLPLPPATYRLKLFTVDAKGAETPLAGYDGETLVNVLPSATALPLEIVSLELPSTLLKTESKSYTVKVMPRQSGSIKFYIRLRQFTGTNGEIMYMKTASFTAGTPAEFTFKYKPAVADGRYMPVADVVVGSTTYMMDGLPNFYREVVVTSDPSGTDSVINDKPLDVTISRELITVNSNDIVHSLELYTATGVLVATSPGENINVSSLPRGLYILRAVTDQGTHSLKVTF